MICPKTDYSVSELSTNSDLCEGNALRGVIEQKNKSKGVDESNNKGDKRKLRMETWNVRSFMESRDRKNRKEEIKINNIGAVELCEVRWKRTSEIRDEEYKASYSGPRKEADVE